MTQTGSSVLLDAALAYAARGWRVIALHTPDRRGRCSCGKPTCDRAGKHPRWHGQLLPHGLKSATTDPGIIRVWWSLWPDANIGIVTGAASGIWALDIDPDKGGDLSLEALYAQHGALPETVEARTGGGTHLIFAHPGPSVRNRVRFAPGLDTRGDDGYIVVAPSRHASGAQYAWVVSPDDCDPVPAPPWLLDLIAPAVAPPGSAGTAGVASNGTHPPLPPRTQQYLAYGAPPGSRNSELYAAAQQFYAAGYTQAEADAQLRPRARADGLADDEIDRTIASAYRSTTVSGPAAPPAGQPAGGGAASAGPSGAPSGAGPRFNTTDLGNAARLATLFCDDIRYVPAWGQWLIWETTHWQRDTLGRIYQHARSAVSAIYAEAAQNPVHAARLGRWAITSEGRARMEAMVVLAQTEPGIAVLHEALDADRWKLNCRNGTLELKTGQLAAHDRADLITRRIEVTYDPQAPCPRWRAFLTRIFAGDDELITYVQRLVGYSLTGDISEQCLAFAYGVGKNGKSTFFRVLLTLLGAYAQQASSELIMLRQNDTIPVDVARLVGVRLVVTSEIEGGRRMAESKVKDLTGGDRLVARFMRQDLFEFDPTHKLWIYGNHKPIIRGADEGIWRRIRLIPFTVIIPPDERDPHLAEALLDELPGILNWAVQGCLDWQRHGLGHSQAVEQATAGYHEEMDILADFIVDCCEVGPHYGASAAELHAAYLNWCVMNGESPVSQTLFGRMLSERGFAIGRDRHTRRKIRTGIRVRP